MVESRVGFLRGATRFVMRTAIFFAGVSCLVAFAHEAVADATEPIRLEYRAPSSCPDETAMLARIRVRLDVRLAVGAERARTFVVTISADGPRVIGTITSVNALGEPSARALGGADCMEVVDALALVAAMTLHPELQANEAAAPAA